MLTLMPIHINKRQGKYCYQKKCCHSRVQCSVGKPAVCCQTQTPEAGISSQALLADRRVRSSFKITLYFINAKKVIKCPSFLMFQWFKCTQNIQILNNAIPFDRCFFLRRNLQLWSIFEARCQATQR